MRSLRPTPEVQLYESDGKPTRHGFNMFRKIDDSLAEITGQIEALTITDNVVGLIPYPANGDYRLCLNMAFPGTISKVTTRSESGTCTATWKINTTALGGTANSVSSTEQEQAHTTANEFVAGDDLVLTVSANSSCFNLSFNITYTRSVA